MSEDLEKKQQLVRALVSVDKSAVSEILSTEFTTKGIDHVADTLQQALEEIGTAWENGSMSLAQVYMSGVISEEILNSILPANYLSKLTQPKIGTAVFLDHHNLGMKIVSSLVRSAGYPVVDLGVGVNVDNVIDFIGKEEIKILLISVLMLPSALAVEELIQEIARTYPDVKIVVGGAPFRLDTNLSEKVGAHEMGKNAGEIFEILSRLKRELI
ncbi:cobalamin B12-binding domain-containing protein [Desulfogranum marinum]|uniref:cobalamin B12-binding domain-containing protein n=1 Tax=Desulfogranum marinum TaxID=453220 RepID=UPI0019624590|nr:cobalamin-dependent protein [Desulfogranum marinum]MBM9512183.1 cobalamin B12-binding domain-containing protein [Desulfogranum marinum]